LGVSEANLVINYPTLAHKDESSQSDDCQLTQSEPYLPIISSKPIVKSPVSSQGDLYIFVGVNHYVPEQHQFFNEFLVLGNDNLKVEGIDLIVSESFWTGEKDKSASQMLDYIGKVKTLGSQHCFGDLQGIIDYYLRTGDSKVLPYLKDCVRREPFRKLFNVEDIDIEGLKIVRGSYGDNDPHSYDILAGDLSYQIQSDLLSFINRLQLLEIRDYNSIRFIKRRLQGNSKLTPEIPAPKDNVNTFVKNRITRAKRYRALPKDEKALEEMIIKAKNAGKIIWGIKNIYTYIQGKISDNKRKSKGKVILSKWGHSHTEKEGIEKYLGKNDRSFYIVMNGGASDTTLVFDKVIKKLGWEGKTFAWLVGENIRDADLIIHLPVDPGREPLKYEKTPSEFFDPEGVVLHLRKKL